MRSLLALLIFILSLFWTMLCVAQPTEGIRSYQKKLSPLSAEHKQVIAQDIDRYYSAGDLWDILQREFALPHYEDNPLVQQKIHWYYQHPHSLVNAMKRATPWLYFILQQTHKRHLPAELVLLPIIESSYNPFAKNSTSGAAGLWQMMPETASGYGVRQNWWYDGRQDVVTSTKAALNHLSWLKTFFDGNWLLAIAAYDTGEGNVLAAIRKNIRDGEGADFWTLPLAKETRDYVPRLLALATIIQHPEDFPLDFPAVPNAPYLAEINPGTQIDLKQAAALAGMSFKELKQFNSGYQSTATAPTGPFRLVLPIENVATFSENLAKISHYPQLHWMRYDVQQGDTLEKIAARFSLTPEMIRQHNPSIGHTIKPGTKILVASVAPSISETLRKTSQPALQPLNDIHTTRKPYTMQAGDTLYMVRKSDTLKTISDHFHLQPQAILALNHIKNNAPQPGHILIIPTHSKTVPTDQVTPGNTVYVVKQHDTIENIANRFHTTPALIRIANLMSDNQLTEGDQLLIPTHV
ncbi:MAG: LysM peptidoglycan-binding domain-containing protein [Gammaproteobacteria bacterium]|nr:LysM peptidoglycan-binding domain-containing protein [Gammaproteobacteria bacterium]